MCEKCERVMKVWDKDEKTEEDLEFLRREVPKVFKTVEKYWDEESWEMIFVIQCRFCGKKYKIIG